MAVAWRRSTAGPHLRLSWLLYLGLALSLTRSVWVEDYAFLRAVAELYLLGVAFLLARPGRWPLAVVAGGAVGWGLLAIDLAIVR